MKIRHRITIWVASVGLLTSLVFSLVIFWEMRDQPLAILDSQLHAVTHALSKQLAKLRDPSKNAQAHLLLVASDRYWVKIYDHNQHLIYQSDLSRVVDLPLDKNRGKEPYMVSTFIPKERVFLHQDDDNNVTFRVMLVSQDVGGATYLMEIARPVEDFDEEVFDWVEAINIGLIISSIILMGVSYILAGRIVSPIAAINQLAREINANTLEKKNPPGEKPR